MATTEKCGRFAHLADLKRTVLGVNGYNACLQRRQCGLKGGWSWFRVENWGSWAIEVQKIEGIIPGNIYFIYTIRSLSKKSPLCKVFSSHSLMETPRPTAIADSEIRLWGNLICFPVRYLTFIFPCGGGKSISKLKGHG